MKTAGNIVEWVTSFVRTPPDSYLSRVGLRILEALKTGRSLDHLPMPIPTPTPIVIDTCRKLKLSEKETLAVIWAVCHNTGSYFEAGLKGYDRRSDCSNLQHAVGMSPTEILYFLSPERQHIEEGLLVIVDGYDETVKSQLLKIPREVLSALSDVPLGQADYPKIMGTTLAGVLEERGLIVSLNGNHQSSNADLKVLNENESVSESESAKSDVVAEIKQPEAIDSEYIDDLDYLGDLFDVVASRAKLHHLEMDPDDNRLYEKQRTETSIRELKSIEKTSLNKLQLRMSRTSEEVKSSLRIEQLRRLHNFSDFEVWVILTLVGSLISEEVKKITKKYRITDIGTILGIHLPGSLRDQMQHRKSFYKKGPLIKSGIIRVNERFSSDLMECTVEIDKRMLDYVVGLDTEFQDLADGTNLYTPQVNIDQVVLPDSLKSLIVSTIETSARARQFQESINLGDRISYGTGLVMMFHGPPGTGKTMTANALAKKLGKRVLQVTLPLFSETGSETFEKVFREATLQNALVFFDECDVLMESRDKSKVTTMLLTDLERFDGMLIMATNRPFTLDPALHRRISLSLEFPHPDASLRRKIWLNHIPPQLEIDPEVDWNQLTIDYELSGGFIKNALLGAINLALQVSDPPIITNTILNRACQLQVNGRLQSMLGNTTNPKPSTLLVPRQGLDNLIVKKQILDTLKEIVRLEKAKAVMKSNWNLEIESGSAILFMGDRGTGKTMAAECIAYELSRTLRIVTVMEIINSSRYAQRGDTTHGLFNECRDNNVVLLIEGVELLKEDAYSHFASHLFFHVERAAGIVILSSTSNTPLRGLDIRYEAAFSKPDTETRLSLWKHFVPSKMPISSMVDFNSLSRDYQLTGSQIRAALMCASANAALRDRAVSLQDLKEACSDEVARSRDNGPSSIYQ